MPKRWCVLAHRPRGTAFPRLVRAEDGSRYPSEVATVAFEWVSDAQVACGASQLTECRLCWGWPCRVSDEARSQMLRFSIRDNCDG